MKCIVLLFALCALLLVAAEARTTVQHSQQLHTLIQHTKPAAMQRRFWAPLKTASAHKKASRRSSEEGLIGECFFGGREGG